MAGVTELAGLVDGTTIRAVGLALGADVEAFEPPTAPDPALVGIVDEPFGSVADVAGRLSRLEDRLRERGDRRAVFLTVYTRTTREVQDGIEGDRFVDPEWMREYVVTFANYYRRAFLAFERGNAAAVPDPWRVAFGTALRDDVLAVQDAFLGVNAHINYDLAFALEDVGIDPNRERKRADHRAVNDILARLVDAQQDALADVYAPVVDDIDAAFGRLDEVATLVSLTEGREQAWRGAVALTDFDVPPVPTATRWVLRATATGAGAFIRSPPVDDALLGAARVAETDDSDLDAVLERAGARMDETRPIPGD